MNYSTSYQNPSLEDSSNESDRRKARIGSIIFLIILLILIIYPFYTTIYPLPEAGGLVASFGNVEIAGSGSAEPTEDPKPETKNNNTATTKVEDVETNDNIKSETVKTEKTPSTNKTNPNPSTEPTKAAPPPGPKFGDFAGNGNDKGDGKVGSPDGKDNMGGAGGNGKGDGKGDGQLTGDRPCKSNCNQCDLSATEWEKISEIGTAYVEIVVDQRGKVISAKMADAKQYPQNANIFGSQADIAIKCAKQRVYDPVDVNQNAKGVVTIKFGRK